MQESPDRRRVDNVAVLVSDGESSDRDAAVYQAHMARNEGATLIALGELDFPGERLLATAAVALFLH